MKTDDNVVIDFPRLSQSLVEVEVEDVILCPSVMRNLKVWRHNESMMMGKWAVDRKAWAPLTYLPHCNGWLYVTTPKVMYSVTHVSHRTPLSPRLARP